MGVKQILTDDLTGQTLPDDTEPQEVKFGGKTYKVYLSADSSDRLVKMLSGEQPLSSSVSSTPRKTAASSTGTRQKTETYGHDYAEVKAWAIANGVKGSTGAPVTENTTRIGQTVYDAYHAAQS